MPNMVIKHRKIKTAFRGNPGKPFVLYNTAADYRTGNTAIFTHTGFET